MSGLGTWVATSECEAVWQRTLSLPDFDPAMLAYEQSRNDRPAYGLTLVADYPLPDEILMGIEPLRRACRQGLGDAVVLYPDDCLHLTVYSLWRSQATPLSSELLRRAWLLWLPMIEKIAGQGQPSGLLLRGLSITWNGAVLVCGVANAEYCHLQGCLSRLPGVATPRDVPPHITIGQLARPFGSSEMFAAAMTSLQRYASEPVGLFRLVRLRMLYYGSRLLDQVLCSVVIPLNSAC